MDYNIVTLHRANNYGAVLQCYALKEFISKLGYSVGVYDSKQIKAKTPFSIRNIIINSANSLFYFLHYNDFNNVKIKYNDFAEEYLNINNNRDAEVFIAGSDQIWNPIVYNSDFYLRFVDQNSVKASYAASIGVSSIPITKRKYYYSLLHSFDRISVREEQAKNDLSCILNRKDIRVDLDPVFLLNKEEWGYLADQVKKPIKGKYILMYILHVPKNLNALSKWLKRKIGAKLVLIDLSGYKGITIHCDQRLYNIGPIDFISLIKNSEAVITTSFHGTAFSLLFEKEVYSILNSSFPSRISNLSNKLCFPIVDDNQYKFSRIKYSKAFIENELEEQRKSSMKFILDLRNLSVERHERNK